MNNVNIDANVKLQVVKWRLRQLVQHCQRSIDKESDTLSCITLQLQKKQEFAYSIWRQKCLKFDRFVKGISKLKKPKGPGPVNNSCRTSLDYSIYHSAETPSSNDVTAARHVPRWSSRVQVQLTMQMFDLVDYILIIGFVFVLKMAERESGSMKEPPWVFLFFMRK